MPGETTVWDWGKARPDFAELIAGARTRGFDAIALDALDIADNGTNDWMAINDEDNGGYRVNGEAVARSKLRVETRLKLLAKWDPKRYGDKLDVEHSASASLADLIAQSFAKKD